MVLGPGHDNAVDQHARNLHLAGIEGPMSAHSLDLRDDEAARILGGHRQRQIVEGECLPFHGDVSAQVRGGAAQQRHGDRKRGVEQPLLVVDLHDANQVLRRTAVDLAAFQARIDKGTHANLGQRSGAMPGDVAKQLSQRTQRQVIGLDAALYCHRRELRYQAPMTTHGALDQAVAGEAIQAAIFAVARCRGKQQRQVARRAGLDEALFQGGNQFVRGAAADEARAGHRVAIADDSDRVGSGNDLVLHRALARNEGDCAATGSSSRKSSINPIWSSAISAGA